MHLNMNHMLANTVTWPPICELVSRIPIQLIHIALTDYVANWDCEINSALTILTRLFVYAEDSQMHLKVVELCTVYTVDWHMLMWPQDSDAPAICN